MLAEARWASPEVLDLLAKQHPRWQRDDGACPACVQQAMLQLLLEKGDDALHESIQSVWPGWDAGRPKQWHGLMTAVTAAGNGWLSHGLYRGLASEAEVVLIQVRNRRGRITNAVDDIRVRENDGLGARGHGREQADAEPNPAHPA